MTDKLFSSNSGTADENPKFLDKVQKFFEKGDKEKEPGLGELLEKAPLVDQDKVLGSPSTDKKDSALKSGLKPHGDPFLHS